MKDGGWTLTEKGWELHPSQEERVRLLNREHSARLEALFADYPRCELCGQRVVHLDEYGLCSKVTQAHVDWRARERRAQPERRTR